MSVKKNKEEVKEEVITPDVLASHPILIHALDESTVYSYLMKTADGATDVFSPDEKKLLPMGTSFFGRRNESSADGDYISPVNLSSERGTLKAFHRILYRGGRIGLRSRYTGLKGQPMGLVLRMTRNEWHNTNFFEEHVKMSQPIPILIVGAFTEASIREAVDTLSQEDKQEITQDEYTQLQMRKFWSPLLRRIDQWRKDGEEEKVLFVRPDHLDRGREWLLLQLQQMQEEGVESDKASIPEKSNSAIFTAIQSHLSRFLLPE